MTGCVSMKDLTSSMSLLRLYLLISSGEIRVCSRTVNFILLTQRACRSAPLPPGWKLVVLTRVECIGLLYCRSIKERVWPSRSSPLSVKSCFPWDTARGASLHRRLEFLQSVCICVLVLDRSYSQMKMSFHGRFSNVTVVSNCLSLVQFSFAAFTPVSMASHLSMPFL